MTQEQHRRSERGNATIQLAILAPALLAFTLLCVAAGRIFLAVQAVDAAAFDAARTASIARSAHAANTAARSTALNTLTNRQLRCVQQQVSVNTAGFSLPPGTPASVQVTLRCELNLSDIALPGLPSTMTVTSAAGSAIDTFRERGTR